MSDQYLAQSFDRNGELLRVDFSPSSDMVRFALARASLKNINLKDDDVMRQLGMGPGRLKSWRETLNPHFEAWLCKAVENFSQNARETLFAIGVDRAFRDGPQAFNYWREVSKTVGAISADKIEVHTVSKGVDELASMSDEDLAREEERILGELIGKQTRALEASAVAEPSQGEGSIGSEGRDSPLQEGSKVLA